MRFRRIGIIISALLMLLAAPDQGQAQENFPNRPIRIVIPYSPGSVTDVFARIIAQNMDQAVDGGRLRSRTPDVAIGRIMQRFCAAAIFRRTIGATVNKALRDVRFESRRGYVQGSIFGIEIMPDRFEEVRRRTVPCRAGSGPLVHQRRHPVQEVRDPRSIS